MPLSSRLRALSFLPMLFGLVAGCGLELGDDSPSTPAKNECTTASECGGGMCSDGVCQTGSSTISSLLFSMTPPAGTPSIAGATFTQVVDGFDAGSSSSLQVALGHVSHIDGLVQGAALTPEACVPSDDMLPGSAAEDGSLPVRITLTPRARLLGIPNPPVTADTGSEVASSYGVDLTVPPGTYDVYVEPLTLDSECVRPPYLLLDLEVPSGDVDFDFELPEPESLNVEVRFPKEEGDLDGWTVDIVEQATGRLLSNKAILREAKSVETNLSYAVNLAFSQVEGDEGEMSPELLRLSPPEELVAPTYLIERSVLELFQDGKGLVDQLAEIPEPVKFSARVATAGSPVAAPSTVTLVATEIAGATPGTVGSFSQTVKTDDDGFFETELLPGTYRLRAEPSDSAWATVEETLVVADLAEEQAGKTIEVYSRPSIIGRLRTPSSQAAPGVSISALAAPVEETLDLLDWARGKQIYSPVASSSATSGGGRFEVLADAGTFHLVARPQESSGFAWFVMPGVELDTDGLDLGTLSLPLPTVNEGVLVSLDTGDAVPNALIRAYAFLKEGELTNDEEKADSVIQVAESRTGEGGRFRLQLPSSFK